jgi:hypothetical protein
MKIAQNSGLRELSKVCLEFLISSYGSTTGAAMTMTLLYQFFRALSTNLTFCQFNRIFSVPYFPVQIAFGFAVGYVGAKRLGTRFSIWIWTLPFLIFIWHFVAFEPSIFENVWSFYRDRHAGPARDEKSIAWHVKNPVFITPGSLISNREVPNTTEGAPHPSRRYSVKELLTKY